jgi:hypothetical protein
MLSKIARHTCCNQPCLHGLQHAISDVSALKESVYGAAGSGPAAALENAAVAVGGSAPAAQVRAVKNSRQPQLLYHTSVVLQQ